jgi:GNAT acetyltransferase-like protein
MTTPLRVRCVLLTRLEPADIDAWASLEQRALEPNAYLSPYFILPAVRHLVSPRDARNTAVVLIETGSPATPTLVGVGVFVRSMGTASFPLPHLRAFMSPHSFLTGLLVQREEAEQVVAAFFRYFCRWGTPWHGVEFDHRDTAGPQAQLMAEAAARAGARWHGRWTSYRATFVPSWGGEEFLQSRLSGHRVRHFRQMRRRLERSGIVSWRALVGRQVQEPSIERFLEMEHMGWKGEAGTSLRACRSHESFFREMIANFRKDERLFFTELAVDDIVVASTTNLISGASGFAFKIGWHPEYAKASPGLLNEVEFIRHAPGAFGDLSWIDSGAEAGSFIEQLWPGRRELSSGFYGTTSLGRTTLRGIDGLRALKRRRGSSGDSAERPRSLSHDRDATIDAALGGQ